MILSFEFHYVSQNGVLQNLLKSICEDFEIDYKIDKNDTIVTLYVDAEEEKLGSFSDFLSARLPLSIFFKSSSVNVVDSVENYKEVEDCLLTLPFTPKALKLAKEEKSPFVENEIGVNPFSNSTEIVLKDSSNNSVISANESSSFQELYNKISDLIAKGEKVCIKSSSGDFVYMKVDADTKDKLSDNFTVIATDLSAVEKMVVIKENEIKALASLEKPSIKLKVNSLYAAKEILSSDRVKIKLADDMLIQLVNETLFSKGVDFIYREEISENSFDYVVEVDGNISNIPQVEVTVLENGEILIVSGDGYSAQSVKDNLKKFENSAHAQFTSVIQEHDLFSEQVSCFYVSKTHNDRFMHISKQTGMLDLVSFPVLKSFDEIFSKIKESSTGEKLFENYEKEFPELVKKAKDTKIPQDAPDNIYTMWGICSIILGISDTFEGGAEKMIELAEDFGGQKGPRIDYPLLDPEALVSNFNFIKMIRSSMSFKLAGTDNLTLSFGFIESLAFFLSDSADFYRENLTSERMVLCGSMFAIKRFSEIACRNIQSTNKISFNRELPIDN